MGKRVKGRSKELNQDSGNQGKGAFRLPNRTGFWGAGHTDQL